MYTLIIWYITQNRII